jgi:hypothetical protein
MGMYPAHGKQGGFAEYSALADPPSVRFPPIMLHPDMGNAVMTLGVGYAGLRSGNSAGCLNRTPWLFAISTVPAAHRPLSVPYGKIMTPCTCLPEGPASAAAVIQVRP